LGAVAELCFWLGTLQWALQGKKIICLRSIHSDFNIKTLSQPAVLSQVTDGDHLLGVTPEGTLLRQSAPFVLSAHDVKLIGFVVAVIAFVLVQYALVALTPPRQSTQMMQHKLATTELEAYN